jgi:D-tyrosyl-tRNA(Tyr) deacylase
MIALLQRVRRAHVEIGGEVTARIDTGTLVLVGVERGDTDRQARRLAERIAGYRIFADAQGKMNLSVREAGGQVLLVPQFTLAADTDKGMRPGFGRAADPATGRGLFEQLTGALREAGVWTRTGEFGADMQVSLVNDGPVTFRLRVPPEADATGR